MTTKYVQEWERYNTDGLWQMTAYTIDDEYIKIGLDVTDYKCRALFELIKQKYPKLDNYKDFCRTYREGMQEYKAYCKREEIRYRRFWRKRA